MSRLLNGEEGESIVNDMRLQYPNVCTLVSKISVVRRMYLETDELEDGRSNRHKNYHKALARVRALAEKLPVRNRDRLFAEKLPKLALADQLRALRSYDPDGSSRGKELREAIARLQLTPDNLLSFRASDDEIKECMAHSKVNRLRRNETMIVVADGNTLHSQMCRIVDRCDVAGLSELLLALCAVSGRRFTEIANGRSKFERLEYKEDDEHRHHPHGTVFTGQLKTRSAAKRRIPLLSDYESFTRALRELRQRQGDVAHLSNKEISTRYQGNASRALPIVFPQIGSGRPHDLRAVYAAMIHKAFDWGGASFNRTTMHALGHSNLSQSLSYSTVDLRAFDVKLGNFSVDST